jgi:hypothetical protein
MEPNESLPEDISVPDGEFHHFQLINAEGEIPMSISVLIHLNPKAMGKPAVPQNPITANDVLALHEALETFNGDFISAFKSN